ncbi:MAG: trypsin-like serine protease [Caldilineaceae bacterium]|nr:trypsin-like serine protease [Caldilineaceae bacterium]
MLINAPRVVITLSLCLICWSASLLLFSAQGASAAAGLPPASTTTFVGMAVPASPSTPPGKPINTVSPTGTVAAQFPLAVRGEGGSLPANLMIETRRNVGSYALTGVESVTVANLGLTLASSSPQTQTVALATDPTNENAYDLEAGGIYTRLLTIPATAKRFRVEILDTTAADLDLFVGLDTNNNGRPDEAEELCRSTSAAWSEVCDFPLAGATLVGGVYWLAIQNWEGSSLALDTLTYAVTVIDANSAGPLTISGPTSIVSTMPFDLHFLWNEPGLIAGQGRYGYATLTDLDTGHAVKTIAIDLVRLADDVIKVAETADDIPQPGRTVTYTIDIQAEMTGSGTSIHYYLTDTLPIGAIYVPNSASLPPTVLGNQLLWDFSLSTEPLSHMASSANEPLCQVGLADAHHDASLRNDFQPCFAWRNPATQITYAVQLAANLAVPATLVNQVDHRVDLPNTAVATARHELPIPAVVLTATLTAPAVVPPGSNITLTLTVANQGLGTATQVVAETAPPPGTSYVSGGLLVGNTIRFELGDIPSKSSKRVALVVKPGGELDELLAAALQQPQAPQIIGGTEAAPGAWPWQAAIVWRDTADAYAGQFCGASLVSAHWVLTAAHCVEELSPQRIDVIVGRHALTETTGQRLPVSQVVVHPNWAPAAYDFDIALLRLQQPARLTGTIGLPGAVQPIPLGLPSEQALLAPDRLATVTGWGTRRFGQFDYPATLYQTTVPLVAQEACRAAYAQNPALLPITANMLCAGLVEGGKDACQGDSGGPLVVNDNGTWKQIGIVSWGYRCAEPGFPGIYTRLANFDDWIHGDGTHTYQNSLVTITDADGNLLIIDAATTTTVVADRAQRLYLPLFWR